MNRYIKETFSWSFAKAVMVTVGKIIKFIFKMSLFSVTMVIIAIPMFLGFIMGLIWHSFKTTFDASYDFLSWLGK